MEEMELGREQEIDSAAIDADWDEAEAAPADQPEEQPDVAEADPPDGTTEEQPDVAEADPPDGTTEEQPDAQEEADQTEVFTLKHLDEVKSVGRDEVVVLAQKGLDYDRVRTDRDELRATVEKSAAAVTMVETYAKQSGMTVEQYIDFVRQQELMAQGLPEQTAKAQIEVEKQQAQIKADADRLAAEKQRAEQETQAKRSQEEARQADFRAFFAAHPDVKPDTIPGEVWAMVREGVPLLTAYTKHENQRLKMELEAERKNRDNAARSTGSQNTSGDQNADPYSEGWDE